MTEQTEVREFLNRMADETGFAPVDPRPVVRKARRRLAFTIGATLMTLAAVAAGAVAGVRGLNSAPPVPANPVPIPAYHHNGEIAIQTTLIDPNTGNEVGRLPIRGRPHVTDVGWSPDGTQLTYTASGGVYVLDMPSGESRKLIPCGGGPHACWLAWAPDGSQIAISHNSVLDLVDPDGGGRTTVARFPSGAIQPTWSPDGRRIAFVVGSTPDARRLYVIDRTGENLTLLVDSTPPGSLGIWMPAWAPDGSSIAYLASGPWSKEKGWLLNVTVVDLDGSNPTKVLQAGRCHCLGFRPGLSWSPDGASMALVIPGPDGTYGLYVMNADGSGLRLVTEEPAWGRPAWRPIP